MSRFAFAALIAFAPLSVRAEDDDWLDQWVFPRNEYVRLRNSDGKVLTNWSVTAGKVIAVGEDSVTIRHNQFPGPYEGLVLKSDIVKLADAAGYFTGRIQRNEKQPWAWQRRAEAWTLKGEYDNAIKDLTEAIRLDPRFPAAFNHRGIAWKAKGELDKAIKDYDEAIRLNPKYPTAFLNRGLVWSAKMEHDKAIKDYSEAIQLNPKYIAALYDRGNAWYEKDDFDRAIEDYSKVVALDPKHVSAIYGRGNSWYGKQDYDRAIKDYDEAIRLDPKYAIAFIGRGNAWYGKRDYDRAVGNYNVAIRLNPKDAIAYGCRGLAWEVKADFERAVKDYSEAMRLNPKDPSHANSFARLLATCPDAKYRDGKRAIDMATKACELSEWKPLEYIETLAAAYAEAGNFEKAIEYQTKVLKDNDLTEDKENEAKTRLKLYKQKLPYHDPPPAKK